MFSGSGRAFSTLFECYPLLYTANVQHRVDLVLCHMAVRVCTVMMQVVDARRRVPSFLQDVVSAFNEEPAAQQHGEVRSKASQWQEGQLSPLPLL